MCAYMVVFLGEWPRPPVLVATTREADGRGLEKLFRGEHGTQAYIFRSRVVLGEIYLSGENKIILRFRSNACMTVKRIDGNGSQMRVRAPSLPPLYRQVAYVLGQMQHPATVPALGTVLADLAEHQMVRHEVRMRIGRSRFDGSGSRRLHAEST